MARDTRRIIRGVTVYDGDDTSTYAEGAEDFLQDVLTPEEGKRLQEQGDLIGDGWSWKGKAPAPMPSSPLAQATSEEAAKRLKEAQEARARRRAGGTLDERLKAAKERREAEESAEREKASSEAAEKATAEHARAERAAKEKHAAAHPPRK
jgi:uncharacterized membrane protein YccC